MSKRLSVIIIWTLVLADLCTGLFYNLGWNFYRVGLPLKIIIIFASLIFYLVKVTKKIFQSLYLAMIILFFFWLAGSFVSYLINPDFSYVYSLIVLNRYFFFLVLVCIFLDADSHKSFEGDSNKILDSFFIFNNTVILLGAVFSIDLFSTFDPHGEYGSAHRFGYKGLIFGGNEVAGIYLFGLAHYFRKKFVYNTGTVWPLLMTCLAAMLTGTKALFLGVILMGLYFLIRYRLLLFTTLITPVVILTIFLISYQWKYLEERYLWYTVSLYKQGDIVTFLTSGRNYFLEKNLDYVQSEWTLSNYFTGDAYLYAEMDFFDLYFFFGIGSLIYLYIYVKIFFLKDKTWNNLYIFFILMSVAFIAGHIIQSAVVPLFLLLYTFAARHKPSFT